MQLVDGDLGVTIYTANGDILVQDVRKVNLRDKTVSIDVANTLLPDSVQFKSLSDPKAKPFEQR